MSVKVSVIYTLHNEEENLKKSLDSIKAQTLKDFEVFVIDTLSNDLLFQKLKPLLIDKRFSYIKIEKNNSSDFLNDVLKNAKGKYISFCDPSVIFTKDFLAGMYDCAEKQNAELCVAPMSSSDIYGLHEFASTSHLVKKKTTTKYDTDLVWNPSVTNKLFLKDKIAKTDLEFNSYDKTEDIAFTLAFAFDCNVIACSSKGKACYNTSEKKEKVSEIQIEHYLEVYKLIVEKAQTAFEKDFKSDISDFEKKELKKLKNIFIDELYRKEITVLLYSYYRHFWSVDDESIVKYSTIITELISHLTTRGKKLLFDSNKDIFYNEYLINSKQEMANNPRITVCIGKNEKHDSLSKEKLKLQITSLFYQTMPCFEIYCEERLKDIFPTEWINYPNVKFINSSNFSDFKEIALNLCKTKYIMFQDGLVEFNPKIIMRHYKALDGEEKYGFTTSPLSSFDGTTLSGYSFSDLAFFYDMKKSRISEEDNTYALDLFFCNKLFRTEHLKGIHFSFSENSVLDMYKLYKHSKFKKISYRGIYLDWTEENVLSYLKQDAKYLPSACAELYKKYKSVYHSVITRKKNKERIILYLKRVKRKVTDIISRLIVSFFCHLKVKNRVFFYTIRSDGKLLENIKYVYDACDCEKVVFAKMLPHSAKNILKAKYYLLTSKVIVTDDYLKYCRSVKLRDGQKLIQIWHAAGAFKRFGLDVHSKLTRLEEYNTHSQYSDVCVSSEYVRQFYSHAFGIDIDVVEALGSPRTDGILDKAKQKESFDVLTSKHPLLKEKKIYVYLPTFREIDGSLTDYDPKINWDELNKNLNDDEIFIICRHPVMKKPFFKDSFYSRIKDYTYESTSMLLSIADVVVTDYSSIIFDASLLDTPMVFYCPDYFEYERDFYLDYENDLPGEIIYDSDKLLDTVRKAANNHVYIEKMLEFKEKEVGACDGNSTQRIKNLIMSYLD